MNVYTCAATHSLAYLPGREEVVGVDRVEGKVPNYTPIVRGQLLLIAVNSITVWQQRQAGSVLSASWACVRATGNLGCQQDYETERDWGGVAPTHLAKVPRGNDAVARANNDGLWPRWVL